MLLNILQNVRVCLKLSKGAHKFWLVPDGPDAGQEKHYSEIPPGESRQFFTLAKQTWVLRDGPTQTSNLIKGKVGKLTRQEAS